jgi:hypothetical protein
MIESYFTYINIHNLSSIIFLLLNIVTHFILMRVTKIKYFKSILIGFFIGLIVLTLYEIYFIYKISFSFYVINNFLIYVLFCFFYFAILSTYKTSIRLRVLFEIYNHKEGIFAEEIIKKYNSKEIINIRLQRMIQNNQIKLINGKLYSKLSITLLIAFLLDIFKFFLFGKTKCNFKFFNGNV